MAEEYPYTGEDIDRVTGGYVNSGVLRMWVSEGWLTPGARAKSIRGGPRTFHRETVMKAVLMAELRKHGVSLPACDEWANYFAKHFWAAAPPAKIEFKTFIEFKTIPVCYVIKPNSGTVFPISGNDALQSLTNALDRYGPTFLIVDIIGLLRSAMEILDAGGPDDESEEPEADADDGEVA